MGLKTVEDYGARPHDLGHDDTSMFEDMQAAEGRVLLGPGKHYRITRALPFPISIEGQGSHVCRINCFGNHVFISLRQNFLKGFTLIGEDKIGTGVSLKDPTSDAKWVHDIQLQDIHVKQFDVGMRVHYAFDISMRDVHCLENRYGVRATGTSIENWLASGFFIQDNDEYGLLVDLTINGSHGWSWQTVKIEDNLQVGAQSDFECKIGIVHGLHISGLRLENRRSGKYESLTLDGGHILIDSLYQDTPGTVAIGPRTSRVDLRSYKQTETGAGLVCKGGEQSIRIRNSLIRKKLPEFTHLVLENVRYDCRGKFICKHGIGLI